MIFETTVLLRRWLQHPQHGVVQMLATVPRNNIAGGQWPLPASPTVYADVENPDLAAQDLDPAQIPALVVYVDENVEDAQYDQSNKDYERQRRFRATIAYITGDEPPEKAVREGGFTLRAAKKCLRLFNNQTLSAAYREYNSVKIAKVGPVVMHIVSGAVGKSKLWGFVVATLTVIDEDP